MAVTGGQLHGGTVVNGASQFTYPAGPCTIILSNAGTQTAYVGAGTGITSSNGLPVPAGVVPTVIPVYNGSPGGVMSIIAVSGTLTSFGWMVSSPAGGFPTGTLG